MAKKSKSKSKTTSATEKETKPPNKVSELEDDEEYDYIADPPDGGFGWVVLVACFLINMIIDGFLYAFGAISDDLKTHHKCQEWAVSLVISIACSCYLLSAPLASALCNKWGCRPIGIIGGIIAAAAVATSVFAPNIQFMWLLFGFIGGIGMGLVYLPSIVMVGYYFEKKRAIATGIVTAGTGIGSIIFGPLSRFLFDQFGWKNGLLILSLILLGCVICCVFMQPLKPIRKKRTSSDIELSSNVNAANPTVTVPLLSEKKEVDDNVVSSSTHHSHEHVDICLSPIEHRPRADTSASTRSRRSIKAEDAVRPMYHEDILYPGDVQALPEYKAQPDLPTYIQETTKVPETEKPNPMKAFWDALLNMTNIHVLNDNKMRIISLANVCSMIGFYIPYLFIVKMAISERNIAEKNAVYLLSIIGFSNTISRFTSGWITKIPYMNPLLVNNIGLSIAGVATFLVPLCSTHGHLIAYCIVWGGAIGNSLYLAFHISLTPVIICELVGLEKFSSALGLVFLFRGISSLIAPPVMGAIRDFTASFNIPFIISGISFLVSALMHFVLMWIVRNEGVRSKKRKGQDTAGSKNITV
ncbi:unnamed protein product [Rotaria sordida]|uniref:Major facilitator superfamily (MFS) profile domain-containing protein n=1 Tax=Rotaria sordida TaxID=392033 RepID=A0A815BS07_9BILA|nr:unnamed protein product [Rotaria sordida]